MRKRILFSLFVTSILLISIGYSGVMAVKPSKAVLNVAITSPSDGLEIEESVSFEVSGIVTCVKGDGGIVNSYVEYSVGAGSASFFPVDDSILRIVSGAQPQTQDLPMDESYTVSWILVGVPGVYEIGIRSEGTLAKSGTSEARTVVINGPPPPPGVFYITNEYQDPVVGYGTAIGSFMNTFDADGIYEILSEQKNDQGTKKPVDDTTLLGWIYEFTGVEPRPETTLFLVARAQFGVDDSDTGFDVQFDFAGTWGTVLTIDNEGFDKEYSVDLPDDVSDTLRIRIVDNDRTVGNKETSSLYLDQVYVSDKTQTGWEEVIIADLPAETGRRAVEIADIDGDSMNEIVVGLVNSETWNLAYYDYDGEAWTENVLCTTMRYVHTLSIGDIDGDSNNEIVFGGIGTDMSLPELRYVDLEEGEWVEHTIADPDILVLATAIGDLDNDGTNEVALGLMFSDGYELRYYEYDGGAWTGFNVDDNLGESDGIEIADVDHDGQNELVWLGSWHSTTGTALCYYKYSTDVWEKYTIPCPTGWEMDTGDIDGDGEIEIAWGNYFETENEIRVYDYENGQWYEYNVSDVPNSAPRIGVYHVNIGDLDNDGQNELAFGLADGVIGYLEYDDGEWNEYYIHQVDVVVEVVTVGDLDNDGKNEVLVGLESTTGELRYYEIREGPSNVELLTGGDVLDFRVFPWEYDGTTWNQQTAFPVASNSYGFIGDMIVTDVDGDSEMETIVGISGGTVQILENEDGVMIPTHTFVFPDTSSFQSIAVGDLDNDGDPHLEILVSATNFEAQSAVYKFIDGEYRQVFNVSSADTRPVGGAACGIGDVNNDGDLEFVVTEEYPDEDGLCLLRLFDYSGNTWTELDSYSFTVSRLLNWVFQTEIIDADNDGANEIYVNPEKEPIQLLELQEGQLVCTWMADIEPFSSQKSSCVGDFTNDGLLDIVLADHATDLLYVFETVGGAIVNTFNVSVPDLQYSSYNGMKIGDIDTDGQNELVYVSHGDEYLRIFRNGELIHCLPLGYAGSHVVAIGNYDND
ncbi:VCBS repeat-containing protein [Candidatus Thorarchaeota archaeon]|nr:MAG: VCBS repeat-containing protein [Candidatus Thorarchaeota archaeon]